MPPVLPGRERIKYGPVPRRWHISKQAEMKREAIRRMELLKLDARTIRDFERDGSVSLSQQIGDQIFLQPSDDEISARVAI